MRYLILKKKITDTLGMERAALFDVEIHHLVEKGHTEEELIAFLETYGVSTGMFYALSMLRRSNLAMKDIEESTKFLFNCTPVLLEEFKGRIPRNSRILDFGCGRGLVSCSLALTGHEVHGVDTSSEFLSIAERLASTLQCSTQFSL